MMKKPRSPRGFLTGNVTAWLRYYQRMEAWHLDHAAHLVEYPTSRALNLVSARRYAQGVTELLLGAHSLQMNGQWS